MRSRASFLVASVASGRSVLCSPGGSRCSTSGTTPCRPDDDTEYTFVVLALCAGVAYSLKWVVSARPLPGRVVERRSDSRPAFCICFHTAVESPALLRLTDSPRARRPPRCASRSSRRSGSSPGGLAGDFRSGEQIKNAHSQRACSSSLRRAKSAMFVRLGARSPERARPHSQSAPVRPDPLLTSEHSRECPIGFRRGLPALVGLNFSRRLHRSHRCFVRPACERPGFKSRRGPGRAR